MADKMLDKVAKLLAKAENAGTPEEAETFMAGALRIAAANSIDLAVARLHQANKQKVEEVEVGRVITVNPSNRKHNRKHFVDLGLAIVETNDCESLISGDDRKLIVTGFPSDIDVVAALFTHLSIEMVSECDRALRNGANKEVRTLAVTRRVDLDWEDRQWGLWSGKQWYDENPDDDIYIYRYDNETEEEFEERRRPAIEEARKDYLDAVATGRRIYSPHARRYEGGYRKPVPPPAYREEYVLDDNGDKTYEEKEVSSVDGRVFRNTFYEAFVMKIRRRLWEVKRQAQKDAGEKVEEAETVALALRDKKKEVKEAFEERVRVGKVGTYTSAAENYSRKRDNTGKAFEHGARAAESAPLGTSGRGVEH